MKLQVHLALFNNYLPEKMNTCPFTIEGKDSDEILRKLSSCFQLIYAKYLSDLNNTSIEEEMLKMICKN